MRRALAIPPGGFVAAMAPAAVSIAALDRGHDAVSAAFLWLAAALLVGVAALLAGQAVTAGDELRTKLTSPVTAFGLFTLPAALALVSERLWADGYGAASLALWLAGAAAWAAVGYGVPLLLVTRPSATRVDVVTPRWALPVLATQTLVAAAAPLSQRWAPTLFLFAATTGFLLAWGLYLVVGAWIAQWMLFSGLGPNGLTGRHWIPMSALASSGFAATRLISAAEEDALLTSVRPVLEAFAVTAWAGCTAWLPFILGLELWRLHSLGVSGFVEPNAAFPVYAVAAYAIASHEVDAVFGLSALGVVAEAALWAAVAGAALAAAFTAAWLTGRSVAREDG